VARRSGNEALFATLAEANITTLSRVNPHLIVVTCPHCLQTLGREYRQFGGNFTVRHHSEFIADLIATDRLRLAPATAGAITYHDPCYLGRQHRAGLAPRQILRALGAEMLEMPRHGAGSFCCGAGGAQMWKEEEAGTERVGLARYREATATGAGTVAVACPFCLTMLSDAGRQSTAPALAVKDLAELVAEQLVGSASAVEQPS
jgi:Fe-S oxidoreductase